MNIHLSMSGNIDSVISYMLALIYKHCSLTTKIQANKETQIWFWLLLLNLKLSSLPLQTPPWEIKIPGIVFYGFTLQTVFLIGWSHQLSMIEYINVTKVEVTSKASSLIVRL